MKPRIFITIDTSEIGGAGRCILQFLQYGGKGECDPVVAGFRRGPERLWPFREAVESLGVRFEIMRQRHGFDPSVIPAARRLVRANGTDILESHGYKAHILCLALKKLTGLPWIAYVHGWTAEDLKIQVYNRIDRFIIRFADRILPVSGALRQKLHLEGKAGHKMTTVTNAADLVAPGREYSDIRSLLGIGPEQVVIAVVGRLSPEKGHKFFVEAFEILSRRYERVSVLFVGDGQERPELDRMISDKGLSGRILLTGYQDDVSSYYNACDIVVLPSLAEGMPVAALEAMMFEKPVIASRVGGVPEVVVDGETGCLVEPANPVELAEALAGLVGSPDKRYMLGNAGKARAEKHFNPIIRVRKIMNIYNDILTRRAHEGVGHGV